MTDAPPPPPAQPGMMPEPMQKKGFMSDVGTFFGQKPKEVGMDINEVVAEVTNVSRRLRIIEEHQTNFRRKLQVVEQNMLSNQKKMSTDVKALSQEVSELKGMLHDMENKMLLLIKELRMCAKKDEIQVIQKYLAYWEPMDFVTKKQLDQQLSQLLQQKSAEPQPRVPFPSDV